MRNRILVFVAVLIALSCNKQASDNLRSSEKEISVKFFPKKEHPSSMPGQILVTFKAGSQKRVLENKFYRKIDKPGMKENAFFEVNTLDVEKTLKELRSNPDVKWAGLNTAHETQDIFIPNDPLYTNNQQWNLAAIEADKMWASGNVGSKDVYVVVLDEGSANWFCDYNSKVWVNEAEMNGIDNFDDDNNGYVDDKRGWNWFNGSNQMYTGDNDHGMWCESMIGAESGNGIGMASILPNVKIISLKFLSGYGFDAEAAKAIYYAIWLKNKGINVVAISNSWGGGGYSQILRDAIKAAAQADINFVCAAGNSNLNTVTNPMYPAAYDEPNILSVGASDEANTKAYFSNWSNDSTNPAAVDIVAPGVRIPAIIPINHQEGIGIYSGTSMSCPHVAAAIGAIASVHPEWNYQQRQEGVLNAAKRVDGLKPYATGGRFLNLNNPVFFGTTSPVIPDFTCGVPPELDVTRPSTMQLFLDSVKENVVAGTAILYLSWTKSTDASGIVGYNLQLTPFESWWFGGDNWTGYPIQVSMNQLYNIHIEAVDAWGNWGLQSNIITKDYSGTPPPTDNIDPSIPQNLRADNIEKMSFRLLWDASTDAGGSGLKDYKVHWRPKGRELWSMAYTGTTATSYTANAFVEPETTYEYMILARDGANNHSDTSVINEVTTIGDEPLPDTQIPTLNGNPALSDITTSSIKVSWPAASDNVGVTGYELYRNGVLINSSTAVTFVDAGLSPGTTYSYYYRARDEAGNWSVNSLSVSATTLTPEPPPPTEDDIDPVVTILSPQDGYIIPSKGNKNVKINFTATDNVGVTLRQILIDGVIVATNVSSYTWNANKASKGNHVITCRASDAAGNETSKSVTVIKN